MSEKTTTPSKLRSTKPTNSWAHKNPLTATEICAIIKTCGESGVSSFTWGDLQVTFGQGQSKDALEPKTASPPVSTDPPKSGPIEVSESQQTEREQMALDQLALEDPAAYEKALIQKAEEEDGIPTVIT